MKHLVTLIFIALAMGGCTKAQPVGQAEATKPTASPAPPPAPAQTTGSLAPLTDDYRERCKKWAEEFLYKGKTESEVYSDVKKRHMHYAYAGFIGMFPASAHRAEIEKLMQGFRVFKPSGTKFITYAALKQDLNYDGADCVYRWDNGFSGFRLPNAGMMFLSPNIDGPEDAMSFQDQLDVTIGPIICFGNLQVLQGLIVPKEGGLELEGTLIYPLKP